MASIFLVNKKVRSLVMMRYSIFRLVLLRSGIKTWSSFKWKEPVEGKQNYKSCAYPSTLLKYMSN